ncbi:MAG TPA: multidrug ABC transporter permease [Lactobacillaceae bacterium]|jgi:ABC-2 type transport system permease protein
MLDFLGLVGFHLRLFMKNSYFVTLVVTSTISALSVQYLAAYAVQDLSDNTMWLRAGMIGLWASGTSAAGAIVFQRFQGTLAYVLDNLKGDYLAILTLLMPAASFGLLAFPLSAGLALLLGIQVHVTVVSVVGVLLLWLAVIVIDLVVAGIFVLTINAFVYEGLLLVPVMILGGVLRVPANWQPVLGIFEWVLPVGSAVQMIFGQQLSMALSVKFGVSFVLWCGIAWMALRYFIRAAKQTDRLEVMS